MNGFLKLFNDSFNILVSDTDQYSISSSFEGKTIVDFEVYLD